MWWDQPICSFDCETTGTDPEDARMVQAAIVRVGGSIEPWSRVLTINPGIPIPEEAAAVHGISTEEAVRDGADPAVAIEAITGKLAEYANAGVPLVVFNACYDLTVLDRECRRYDITPLHKRAYVRVIDPLVMDKWLHRYRKGSRKLGDSVVHYGATEHVPHQAFSDAISAARLAWIMAVKAWPIRRARDEQEGAELLALRREWDRVRVDLDELHAAQASWAADQAASLEEYFAKEGKPEHVAREWPWIPPTRQPA